MSAPIYLDGSAAVKLVRRERWSDELLEQLGEACACLSSELLALELGCAIHALELGRADSAVLLTALDELLAALNLIPLSAAVQARAGLAFAPPQPALAAIHLASALAIPDRDLLFISYDDPQLLAARSAGLRTATPV